MTVFTFGVDTYLPTLAFYQHHLMSDETSIAIGMTKLSGDTLATAMCYIFLQNVTF